MLNVAAGMLSDVFFVDLDAVGLPAEVFEGLKELGDARNHVVGFVAAIAE